MSVVGYPQQQVGEPDKRQITDTGCGGSPEENSNLMMGVFRRGVFVVSSDIVPDIRRSSRSHASSSTSTSMRISQGEITAATLALLIDAVDVGVPPDLLHMPHIRGSGDGNMDYHLLKWQPGKCPVRFTLDRTAGRWTVLSTSIPPPPDTVYVFAVPPEGFREGCGLAVLPCPRGESPQRRFDLMFKFSPSFVDPARGMESPLSLTPTDPAAATAEELLVRPQPGSLIFVHASTPIAWVGGGPPQLLTPMAFFLGASVAGSTTRWKSHPRQDHDRIARLNSDITDAVGTKGFDVALRHMLSLLYDHVQTFDSNGEETMPLRVLSILSVFNLEQPLAVSLKNDERMARKKSRRHQRHLKQDRGRERHRRAREQEQDQEEEEEDEEQEEEPAEEEQGTINMKKRRRREEEEKEVESEDLAEWDDECEDECEGLCAE